MRKKLLGIFICTLLIATTVIPISGNIKIESVIEKQISTSYSKSVEMSLLNGQTLEDKSNERIRKALGRGNDLIMCVNQTTDGGYIATGITNTYASYGYDCWLIKTDSSGNEQWNKTFDLDGSEAGFSVQQTTDSGYIITGYGHFPPTGYTDVWLIKTNSNGNMVWNKKYGEITSVNDVGFSVQQTSDGGYAITGATESYGAGLTDVWLIKTDSNGNEQWNKTFGGLYSENGFFCQQIDGGYIITGRTETYGAGQSDAWLIETDSSGNEQWIKTFGGTQWEEGNAVQQITDGYIIIGCTSSYGNDDYDVWLIKTDSNGNELWNKTWDGANTATSLSPLFKFRGGISIQQIDNGYIFTGITDENGNNDAFLIKTDTNGNEQWEKIFGRSATDEAYCIKQTSDDGYIISGATSSYGTSSLDGWLIKTDSNGNEQWNKTFPANSPPNIPSNPEPEDGETDVNTDVDLSWSGGDPDGDPVRYDVYFGTNSPPPKVVSQQSGTTYDPGILDLETEYYWQIVAWDRPGGLSASGPIWSFTTELEPNEPPTAPDIDGPTEGLAGEELGWEFVSDDPDENQVKYLIEWGDGNSNETDYHPEGQAVEIFHTYEEEGDYNITAYAEDEKGLVSEESTFSVKVTTPRSRTVYRSFFLWFLERIPLLERLLSLIRVI